MYKSSSRFLKSTAGKHRFGRYNTQALSSATLGRQDRHGPSASPMTLNLAQRLDAEVARVTPSIRDKKVYVASVRKKALARAVILEGKRVYLVRLTSKADPAVRFLKVGISRMDIRARFRRDMGNYDVELVAESQRFTGKDAYLAETSIHQAFRAQRLRRIATPLATGNTECYVCSVENAQKFVEIVNSI